MGGGVPTDPVVRHERAKKAAAAAVLAHRRAALEHAEQFPSKAAAYAAGYRVGYKRAYVYWHQWARRLFVQRAS